MGIGDEEVTAPEVPQRHGLQRDTGSVADSSTQQPDRLVRRALLDMSHDRTNDRAGKLQAGPDSHPKRANIMCGGSGR